MKRQEASRRHHADGVAFFVFEFVFR